MTETGFFNSDKNKLCYACTIPEGQKKTAGIIFVHAADSNRMGPHRMFVELAERLQKFSIISLRFDMRGCGDSEGKVAGNDINADIEDLLSAINFLTLKFNPGKIFLFGISRGAQVIFTSIEEHYIPVTGAILLSTPFSSSKVAVRFFSNRLKEYLYKFSNPDSLQKFLTGKINFKQIIKTLTFALGSSQRYRRNSRGFITQSPLLFIFGNRDPIAADSSKFYSGVCEKYKVPFKIVEIKDANHSFFHYTWKEQIFDITEKWLTENTSNGGENAKCF